MEGLSEGRSNIGSHNFRTLRSLGMGLADLRRILQILYDPKYPKPWEFGVIANQGHAGLFVSIVGITGSLTLKPDP